METFTELRQFVENPGYQAQKQKVLRSLRDDVIDMPMIRLINGFNGLPFCFTLQSCYGHFVYNGQTDPHNLEPLPAKGITAMVEYRIAYIAFCIENSPTGEGFFDSLREIETVDTENVQFCCAEWFWKRQVNSYALQVEPDRYKRRDKAIIGYQEALHVQRVRNEVLVRLCRLLADAQ